MLRCAVLEILMYYLYIPVSALRAPCISPSSRHFSKQLLNSIKLCMEGMTLLDSSYDG
jgi:hypothetical protein